MTVLGQNRQNGANPNVQTFLTRLWFSGCWGMKFFFFEKPFWDLVPNSKNIGILNFLGHDFLTKISPKNVCAFSYNSPEIIEVKIHNRQTDRQIILPHIRVYVDFFLKLNLLPFYSLRSKGTKKVSKKKQGNNLQRGTKSYIITCLNNC